MAGLGFVEADAADGIAQALFAEIQHGLWGGGALEECAGGQVDALVGGLRREHDGHQ